MREETKKKVVNRLRSIAGHVQGIERMVDNDAYCIDVIKQILAVQSALTKASNLVLESHLQTCVTTAIRGQDPDDQQRVIDEIVDVFEMSRRAK
jgi:DNA-binding FrmR family transcriptional regulator